MKIREQFFQLSLVVFSLIIFLLGKTSASLAAPTQQLLTTTESGSLQGTLIAFEALPLGYKSEFSECEIAQNLPLPDELIPNLGDFHFKVTTNNEDAQQYFDQGMTLFYGFNDEEAIRFFRKAAALDPNMAMAYFGMALAPGTNINIQVDKECNQFAYNQIQKAISLSANVTALERDLIAALATRYTNKPEPDFHALSVAYKDAMAKVYDSYSDNPDVAVIYVDSLMDLHPWKLWTPDGKPTTEDTLTIVDVLEKALRREKLLPRDCRHVGVNHYYIHAMEASSEPHKAHHSAKILASLAPAAGHIVHMPSHIYARLGNYKHAAHQNEAAVIVDKPYVENCKNLKNKECEQVYAGHYYTHNQLFRAVPYAMIGRSKDAIETAAYIEQYVFQYLADQPGLEHYFPSKILMLERFGKWDDILSLSLPVIQTSATQAFWHWARAMAYLGKQDLASAKDETDKFLVEVTKTSCDMFWGNNQAQDILQIAALVLDAKIAYLEDKANNAIKLLKIAVDKQDNLVYDEPIPWPPIREALGAALYVNGRYSEAEQVFREDLYGLNDKIDRRSNPRNGRSLFGLYESLKAQGKPFEKIKDEFDEVWKNADVTLKMSDLF
jgi:tetratricopeptide (TPR) repeat protein